MALRHSHQSPTGETPVGTRTVLGTDFQARGSYAFLAALRAFMGHARMFGDGIYKLAFCIPGVDDAGSDGLALVRGNEIQGADPFGATFHATLCSAGAGDGVCFEGSLSVPPNGELITGLSAGPEGLTVPLRAVSVPADTGEATLHVEVAGQSLSVAVTYVGPLPSGLGFGSDTTRS